MNDPLGRLRQASERLLVVVDETLARCGAPQDHPIWPLLRSVGQLPGDAVAELEALSLDAFRERADLMRSHGERAAGTDDLLRAQSGWEGAAADAATAKLESARAGLRLLAANAVVLGGLMGDMAEWGQRGRVRLARTLGKVLTSAQAVELTVQETEPDTQARAAADIGAEVLAEVAEFWAGARGMVRERLARLDEVPALDAAAAPSKRGSGRLAVEW